MGARRTNPVRILPFERPPVFPFVVAGTAVYKTLWVELMP